MEHRGTVRLETERLILRPFRPEDAQAMYRNWCSDPEVTKYLTWPPHESEAASRALLESWVPRYADPRTYLWTMELKELGEAVGSVSAVELSDETDSVTLGYCLGRAWWGRGLMPEAVKAVLGFFFEQVGAHCVNACHDPRNPNSGKVMRKVGMRPEGVRRAVGRNNQGVCDECWHSILREEYESGNGNRSG